MDVDLNIMISNLPRWSLVFHFRTFFKVWIIGESIPGRRKLRRF